jgi:hypothetical protein
LFTGYPFHIEARRSLRHLKRHLPERSRPRVDASAAGPLIAAIPRYVQH